MSFKDFCGADLPEPLQYRKNNISDVFESAGTLVAQQSLTPDAHPVLGDGRNDLLDLSARIESAGLNPQTYRSVCVVMVDGLGEHLLNRFGSYAPYLNKTLSLGSLTSAYPSTTAASLTSFGTALPPGYHGVAGYEVLNPATGKVLNQLSGWDKNVDPLRWQPHPTVFERFENYCDVATVSLSKYQGSGLSLSALRGGRFIHAQSPAARITLATSVLSARKPALVYLYWGELDQAGHRYGVDSQQWIEQLEELNLSLRRLAERLPSHVLILLTADHGMVDIPAENRIDYSTDTELLENVMHTAGEPRMVQLHLEDKSTQAKEETMNRWAEKWGSKAWILDAEEMFSQGYFGPEVTDEARARIGDVLISAREPIALYDMRRFKPHALHMVGQHGSLTDTETSVPLRLLDTH